jgi:hypothetical protein
VRSRAHGYRFANEECPEAQAQARKGVGYLQIRHQRFVFQETYAGVVHHLVNDRPDGPHRGPGSGPEFPCWLRTLMALIDEDGQVCWLKLIGVLPDDKKLHTQRELKSSPSNQIMRPRSCKSYITSSEDQNIEISSILFSPREKRFIPRHRDHAGRAPQPASLSPSDVIETQELGPQALSRLPNAREATPQFR